MVKTRIYEDIDGCLNASHNARVWRREGDLDQAGYQRAWVHPEYDDYGFRKRPGLVKYRMEWNDRLIDALNEMDVEFVWTTTWRGDALKVGTAMKLIHHPQRILHPISGFTSFPSIEWKDEAILKDQKDSPSPFIAVDDEWDDQHGFRRASLESLGGLVICPDFNFGITPEHVDQMKNYLLAHSTDD